MLKLVYVLIIQHVFINFMVSASIFSNVIESRHQPKSPTILIHTNNKPDKIKIRNAPIGKYGIPVIRNKDIYYPNTQRQVYYIQSEPENDNGLINKEKDQFNDKEILESYGSEEDAGKDAVKYMESAHEHKKPPDTLPSDNILPGNPYLPIRFESKPSSTPSAEMKYAQKLDYSFLTSIINKMSPETQNALVNVLLHTLLDKTKLFVSGKSVDPPTNAQPQIPLKDDLQTYKPETSALPFNFDYTGPVQPISVTIDREKLRNWYHLLNTVKFQPSKTNSSKYILSEEVGKCTKCNYDSSAGTSASEMSKKPSQKLAEMKGGCHLHPHTNTHHQDHCTGEPRTINLTQIFNVHPRLLVVNTNVPAGDKIPPKLCSRSPPVKNIRKSKDDFKKYLRTFDHPIYYVDVIGRDADKKRFPS